MEQALVVENLSKVYRLYDKPVNRLKEAVNPFGKKYHKEFYALKDVSFKVQRGETVGVLGQNGSGKSTLLQIITGVLTATTGSVHVNGRVSALLELGAGFNPELTGLENIYLNGAIMGYSKEDIARRINDIISFADIGDFLQQPVKTYSSGMFVRLAFAVAINVDPEILIVDEALSVGDINFQAKCISRINQLRQKGVTIVLVTHSINTVKTICSKAVYLKSGMLQAFGDAKEVTDMYLRDMRREANQNLNNTGGGSLEDLGTADFHTKRDQIFKESAEFRKRVELFRQGTAEAVVTEVELLDLNETPICAVNFNQDVIIRIYIKFKTDTQLVVGYYIRDDRNLELVGSNTRLEGRGLIDGKSDERYIIDFKVKAALVDGDYNILIILSKPVVPNRSALFVDLIENAVVFQVMERQKVKLWSKVYLENEVNVIKVN